jgi:hypothetical protein
LFVNVNGTWKRITGMFVNVSGTWKRITNGLVNVAGTWKRFFSSALSISQQVEISKATNGTNFLVTLTGTNYYWSPGPPVLTYYFERSINSGATWISLDSGSIVNPSFGGSTTRTLLLDNINQFSGNPISTYVAPNVNNLYRFRVYATYGSLNAESTSTTVNVQGPTDITLSNGTVTSTTLPLSWTSSTGANSYIIEYKLSSSSTWTTFGAVSGTSTTLTGLSASQTYNVRVIPITGSGTTYPGYYGNYSNTVTVSTPALPGQVTLLENYNFSAGNAQLFFTTSTNTSSVQYTFNSVNISGFSIGPFTQNTSSSIPYKYQHNLLSYFVLKTWNDDTYNPATTYYLNNTVWYAGNQYRLTTTIYRSTAPYDEIGVSGQVPTNTSYWTRIQTITYSPGDYVYYAGTFYFARSTFNGFYPTNTTYWSANSAAFTTTIIPYNPTGNAGSSTSSSSTIFIRADGQASDPLRISSGPTFSNVTQTAFRSTFTPSVYTNRAIFYITQSGVSISGYPVTLTVSGSTSTNHDTQTTLSPSTTYAVQITARYLYNSTYGILHDGETTTSQNVTTLSPQPTGSGFARSDGTITPSQPSTISFSASNNQVTSSWTNGTPLSVGSVRFQGSGAGVNTDYTDTTSPFITSDVSNYSSSGTYTATVTNTNTNLLVNVSWNQTNALSYKIDFTSSVYGADVATGNNSSSSVSVAVPFFGGGTFTWTGLTLYNGTNQTGTATYYSNPVAGGLIPTSKSSSRSNSVSLTYTPPAPVNTSIPTLSPTTISIGTTLTAGVGSWSNSPTSYDIRIYRGTAGVLMSETLVASTSGSGTSLTYTVTQADYDSGQRYFRTYVNATNAGGSSGFVAGQERGPIQVSAPVNTVAPSVTPTSGTAGSTTFSSTTGTWSNSPTSYSYQWRYLDQGTTYLAISGATSSTYTPPSNYVSLYGSSLRCYVTASNSGGSATANSNTVTVSTGGSAPATPTGVGLTGSGVVSWTASSGATSYEIEFYTAQSSTGLNAAGPYTVTGIASSPYQLVSPYASPNNWARVRVRARNSNGASAYSAWVPSATTYT